MRIKQIKKYLQEQDPLPENNEERKKWFEMGDVIQFLLGSRENMVPIYVSSDNIFVYSLIVSEDKFRENYITDLLNWNFSPANGYSYCISGNQTYLCGPMDNTGSKILDGSMPIFFLRDIPGEPLFLEINQEITHILGVFWLKNKNAFCKINELGDYTEIATMDDNDITLCTLKREELDFYLFLSKSVLIRVFDIVRTSDGFNYPRNKIENKYYEDNQEETFTNYTAYYNKEETLTNAILRGFQIIRNKTSDEGMLKKAWGEEEREYESFIIHDLKHDKIHECSSNPKNLGNFLFGSVKSDLPFEISPVFFRPEVLAKYKQNPEKYTIEYNRINCRGSWSLKYDINDEGQVFVYIKDISGLPYLEQQYWRSFNEKPKAGISKRAFKSDFMGDWHLDYDPLFSLKNILNEFPSIKILGSKFSIWEMPKPNRTKNIKFLNYVVTDSTKEWEDQILVLHQILVEGLNSKTIKKIANNYKCRESGLKSVKQLVNCLNVLKISKTDIETINGPLLELIHLRSKIVAHATDEEYPEGDLKLHYKELLERCDESMRKLADIINQGLLNISNKS